MKQYCRYCAHCCYGDVVYCEIYNKTMSEKKAKQVNKCKDFIFNEIDVITLNKTYKPREAKQNDNLTIFDLGGNYENK